MILAGTFMVVLDFFIVNVALPSMQAHLHASNGAIEWVVAGYGLTNAVFLITGARLGDRLGRVRVFTIGLALFTLASAGCGLAGTPEVLVISRLVQGCASALLLPNVLAIIGVLYDGGDRAKALAAYGMSMGFAAVVGPAHRRHPGPGQPGRSGLAQLLSHQHPDRYRRRGRGAARRSRGPAAIGRPELDLVGTVLATVGLTAIVLPLVEGRAHGWPLWTWLSLAAAPVLLGAFALQQRRLAARGGTPLMPPELFASRAFVVGLAAQMLFWSGQASFFLVLSLYLQLGRGMSALHSGLVFTILAGDVPDGLAAGTGADRASRPAASWPRARACSPSGHLTLALTVADVGVGGSVLALAPGLALVGAGMGLGITPLATLIMAAAPPEHVGRDVGRAGDDAERRQRDRSGGGRGAVLRRRCPTVSPAHSRSA